MRDLEYITANSDIPAGVSSTARKGDKWSTAKVGEVLNISVTENKKSLGRAAVVKAELVTYKDVIDRAAENHVKDPVALAAALTAAYGECKNPDVFTILTILPLLPE